MAMIYVKTKKDRRAYFEGKIIPQDKFTPVPDTPYIRRLINVHEDLEVEGGGAPIKSGKPTAPKPTAPKPTEAKN